MLYNASRQTQYLFNIDQALNTMNLLWAFTFSKAKDPLTGEPIDINLNVDVNTEVSIMRLER